MATSKSLGSRKVLEKNLDTLRRTRKEEKATETRDIERDVWRSRHEDEHGSSVGPALHPNPPWQS